VHGVDRPVRSGEITARQKIPQRYLEQVLQALVRAGLLTGKRGPQGGYRLGRERRRISLGDIVRVVRTLEADTESVGDDVGSALAHHVVLPIWSRLRDEVMTKLDAVSIEDMWDDARKYGVTADLIERREYTI
jgi:Rrf2 family iron-sulfur cluster assembly transcriptional regulator